MIILATPKEHNPAAASDDDRSTPDDVALEAPGDVAPAIPANNALLIMMSRYKVAATSCDASLAIPGDDSLPMFASNDVHKSAP